MRTKLQNFLSRKFLLSVTGIISGVVLIVNGDVVAGITAICTAIVSYMVTEGYIDAKAVQTVNEIINDVTEGVKNGSDTDAK